MKTLVLGDVNFTYLLEIINYELSTNGGYKWKYKNLKKAKPFLYI